MGLAAPQGGYAKGMDMTAQTDALIARRFDTVIYDLDGTLIDSARTCSSPSAMSWLTTACPTSPRTMCGSSWARGSKVTMGKAFAKFGKVLDDAALTAATKEFVKYYEADPVSHTIAFDGVVDVVAHFGMLGLAQGVCTNKFERPSRMILEHLKLMPPIADVAGSDSFPVRKPDPRHILMLLERMRRDPKRTVMIGDSIHDVEAAHGAGLPAVLVSWGYTVKPASELGAEAVIQRFAALPEALGAIAAQELKPAAGKGPPWQASRRVPTRRSLDQFDEAPRRPVRHQLRIKRLDDRAEGLQVDVPRRTFRPRQETSGGRRPRARARGFENTPRTAERQPAGPPWWAAESPSHVRPGEDDDRRRGRVPRQAVDLGHLVMAGRDERRDVVLRGVDDAR